MHSMTPDDFRRIVESLGVPMALAGARGGVPFRDLAFTKFTGHERGTLANVSLASLFSAGDQKRIQQNIVRVGEGKAASSFVDAQLESPGGAWVQVAFQPALDPRDKAAGVIAVLQDIGAQRETERSLNLSGARLLALAETSPAGAMIENAAGEIELANEALCNLLDIKSAPQSLTGLPVRDALSRSPLLDPKALEKALRKPGESASFAIR